MDLADSQWTVIEPLLSEPNSDSGQRGRPSCHRRQSLNGVLYVVKTGCQWRWLPREFGCWQTAYDDANGNRTQQTTATGTIDYTYDVNSNRLTGLAGSLPASQHSGAYTYDARGRLYKPTSGA